MDLYRERFNALIAYAARFRQRKVTLVGIECVGCVAMQCNDPETLVVPIGEFERFVRELQTRFRLGYREGSCDWIVLHDGTLGAMSEFTFSILEEYS